MKFQIAKVTCQNCVTLIKNSLENEFGKIEVDTSTSPKILHVDCDETRLKDFENKFNELGFELLQRIE
ncbi:heavy metal transport/detoxification protein [Campylobacter sp. MIT 21-1685]|uniref:heavy metal transport/detoxification protein n=1 Tax=unclassified Campylobacter TaxID=2593542 RepID=UPI00224B4718|nr:MULTISPECIES: heavy metal transport/detoxification protein [unclassified Campylobacter]MCX2683679.1 heavy metal transport/detoxification protein [Campylobacter sp. MIT 21-1684]MCX2751964.1 heavy metal transport/detoxification protein [Campylobacter sp. MIT 21-1682]MCX2808174.1 heavy metal transport/detoxification protein [Campylobacter sp. MIT 21-1685]